MTRAERAELRECIRLLSAEGGDHGFTEGFSRLCRLGGMSWPAGEALLSGEGKTVSLAEVAALHGEGEE